VDPQRLGQPDQVRSMSMIKRGFLSTYIWYILFHKHTINRPVALSGTSDEAPELHAAVACT
jgi:hypothetical protein